MHLPARSLRLTRAPLPLRWGRFLGAAAVSLAAGVHGFSARHQASVVIALVSAAAVVAVMRPFKPALESSTRGSVVVDRGVLTVLGGDHRRVTLAEGVPCEPPWSLTWPRDELRSGHLEDTPGKTSTVVAVVTHTRGDQLRVALDTRSAGNELLASLGLDPLARSVRFELSVPPLATSRPLGQIMQGVAVFSLGTLGPLVLLELWLGKRIPELAALLWGLEAASALGLLLTRPPAWRSGPVLESGHDGLLLPSGVFLPWRDVARVNRTGRGLRLTSGKWVPVITVDLTKAGAYLPSQRLDVTSPTDALRNGILRVIDQHRRVARAPLTPPAPPGPGETSAAYREAPTSFDAHWATLCRTSDPVAARVAAAQALALVDPALRLEARRRLVEPAITDALDRQLAARS